MSTRMIELRASIFDPDEARRRLKLSSGGGGEVPLERGRQDKPGMVVATTTFRASLPAEVPVHGAIELGIPAEMLRRALTEYEKTGGVVFLKGDFSVNYVTCTGSMRLDFAGQTADEFIYTVTPKKTKTQ